MVTVAGLFWPGETDAFFTSDANATNATLAAGTLVLSASTTKSDLVVSASSGDDTVLATQNTGSVAEQYRVTTTPVSCTSGFWNGLDVTVTKGTTLYQGAIGGLLATSTSDGAWNITVTASSTLQAAQNETCSFSLVIDAWQDEFASATDGGFSDSDALTLTITAADAFGSPAANGVVLNEIYPNPDNSAAAPLEREWVEIYNGTSGAVDVEGWGIGESAGSSAEQVHLISASNTCTGGAKIGYARPYDGASTIIPAGGLLVIEFCAESRLNNSGDTVTLYNTSSTLLDAYTYASSVKGKSIARIPDGGNWVDPVPTPGTPNTATAAELQAAGWSDSAIADTLGTTAPNSMQGDTGKFVFASDLVDTGSTSTTTVSVGNFSFATSSTSSVEDGQAFASTTASTTEATATGTGDDGEDDAVAVDPSNIPEPQEAEASENPDGTTADQSPTDSDEAVVVVPPPTPDVAAAEGEGSNTPEETPSI